MVRSVNPSTTVRTLCMGWACFDHVLLEKLSERVVLQPLRQWLCFQTTEMRRTLPQLVGAGVKRNIRHRAIEVLGGGIECNLCRSRKCRSIHLYGFVGCGPACEYAARIGGAALPIANGGWTAAATMG